MAIQLHLWVMYGNCASYLVLEDVVDFHLSGEEAKVISIWVSWFVQYCLYFDTDCTCFVLSITSLSIYLTLSRSLSLSSLPPSLCPLTLPLLKASSPFTFHRKLQLTNTCDHIHTWPTHLNMSILLVTQLTFSFNCSGALNKCHWITVT